MPITIPDDDREIYAAVGYAQTRWAQLEHLVSQIYCECVNPFHYPPAESAFWAVVSFEAKLKMTSAAVEHWLKQSNAPLLSNAWAKVSKRISEKARKRNQLAHGSIFRLNEGSKIEVSFVPYFFQGSPGVVKYNAEAGALLMGKLPKERWSAKRIEDVARGFDVGKERLRRFLVDLRAHNRAWFEQQEKAHRIFLEAQAQASRSSKDNQQQHPPSAE